MRQKARRRGALKAAAACAVILAGVFAATSLGQSPSRKFPLWRDVPVAHFAALHEGFLQGTQWAAYVFRGVNRHGTEVFPCLVISEITRGGIHGSAEGCGPLPPAAGREEAPPKPLISREEPGKSQTFLAMAFGPSVARVRLDVEQGRPLWRATRYLGVRQQRRARVGRMRYLAVAYPRAFCIKTITGYNGRGQVVVTAPGEECPLP